MYVSIAVNETVFKTCYLKIRDMKKGNTGNIGSAYNSGFWVEWVAKFLVLCFVISLFISFVFFFCH